MRLFGVGVATFLSAVLVPAVSAQAWAAGPSLRVPRAALTLVANDDAIFAIGGTTPEGATVDIDRFDGRTWSEAAPLPSPRGGFRAIVIDGAHPRAGRRQRPHDSGGSRRVRSRDEHVWRDAVWVGGGSTQAMQPHTSAGTAAFERWSR